MANLDSPQNLYTKNLRQSYGYPLWFPEPKPGLPLSYAEHGLHIGDVGYVNHQGMFHVLFNIRFPLDHDLHKARREELVGLVGLTEFDITEVPLVPDGISPGSAICHGIRGPQGDILSRTRGAPCSFKTSSTSGAILILPAGAVCQYLDENLETEFRKLAEKHALGWSQFARRNSLYLITGFHKTNSWFLASFHDVRPTEQDILKRDDAGRYNCDSRCVFRRGPEDNSNENQTVFISGFKIEVRRWDELSKASVERISPHPRSIWGELTLQTSFLLGILVLFCRRIASTFKSWVGGAHSNLDVSVHVDSAPALCQPFHPCDVINHYLLDKDPGVQVAITHDNQWLSMIEKDELSFGEMMGDGRFIAFLEENYRGDSSSDNSKYSEVVYLRGRMSNKPVYEAGYDSRKADASPKTLFFSTPDSVDRFVITHIRAEHFIGRLRHTPIGFFILTEFDGIKRRSRCKPASLSHGTLGWDDEIALPTDFAVKVRFSIMASFEFEPMLASGEVLCVMDTNVGTLVHSGSTYLMFSSREEESTFRCSLLVTLEQWRSDSFSGANTNLGCSRIETELTDEGYSALFHYHAGAGIERLLASVECFSRALSLCPPGHECHGAALFNHATATFVSCQVRGTISELNTAIDHFRKSLAFRPVGHLDRPATLLHLSRALLYAFGRLRHKVFSPDEIEVLVIEVKQSCSQDSYSWRAADLVTQTLKRYRVLASVGLAELHEVVQELRLSTRIPSDWHFDKPERLINLSAVLRRRFDITNNLRDLEESISVIEETMRLIPDTHFDRPWALASLGDALCARFTQCGEVGDLDIGITMIEDAAETTPDDHLDKPWMLASLGDALYVRFVQRASDTNLERSISIMEDAIHLAPNTHFDRPSLLASLGDALRVRFIQRGDTSDLERSISIMEDAVNLASDRFLLLTSLSNALRVRFMEHGDISDLERSISIMEDVAKSVPGSDTGNHPNRSWILASLADVLCVRSVQGDDISDFIRSISIMEDVVHHVPNSHIDKPRILASLGSAAHSRVGGARPNPNEKRILQVCTAGTRHVCSGSNSSRRSTSFATDSALSPSILSNRFRMGDSHKEEHHSTDTELHWIMGIQARPYS